MELKPLIGISYELIFQIFNTILVLAILILIIYMIYNLIGKVINKNKYQNRIIELESKVKELENKINNNKV
ncbi:hypothetical protein [Paeniclostridium hominis]|uniref:hypothetical protein n=1 Tax=Paeniclostridium hominis TaxID=2764329 RepID=UPI0022E31142|nr:hypothetical protein [Paeniclostridium hominis]